MQYQILNSHQNRRQTTPSLQLHASQSADVFQILPPPKGKKKCSFNMNGDVEAKLSRRLKCREWSTPSLTRCISPSLPLLRTLHVPIVHPFQQRWPTTYAHFHINKDLSIGSWGVCVSYLAWYTKLVLIDMEKSRLFNTTSKHWV